MSITVTIQGDAHEVRAQMKALLGDDLASTVARVKGEAPKTEPTDPSGWNAPTPAPTPAPAPAAEPAPTPARRGRPPKNPPAPASEAQPQATVGDNGASGMESTPSPAAAPSAPSSPAAAGTAADQGSTGADAVTFDEMKAALQKLALKREGDADDNAGLARVSALIGQYGEPPYRKIKEIKPEHFAALKKAAEEFVA